MINLLQITSGRGPSECCWVAYKTLTEIMKEAAQQKINTNIIETNSEQKIENIFGEDEIIIKSTIISLECSDLPSFIQTWEGTIQWIGDSMFRKKHKRRNWFVGVNKLNEDETIELNLNEIKIEKMKSSGPGGQHVNKTESAIRITHIPTGLIAIGREERSQHLNKKLALSRLYKKILMEQKDIKTKQKHYKWGFHNSLVLGNPTRIYEKYSFVKRTI